MKVALKPIAEQTIVITGASSGIGLATARAAARAGARVMLAARDEVALARIRGEIRAEGGIADFTPTDVGIKAEVHALVARTIERFGGFDTWVNNAGVGIIATVERTSTADHHKLFETNYFGLVHGSIAAVAHFRETGRPGALINVGSVVGDMAIPLSVAYSATKHAIKGFTDGFRVELMREQLPVSVTLIKPSAIDTRFFDHAGTEMGGMGKAPGPHYAPEVVAGAILHAAQHPKRDFPVGASAVFGPLAAALAPRTVDRRQAATPEADLIDFGEMPESDTLHEIPREGRERSRHGHGRGFSVTTSAQSHPTAATALGIALLTGLGLGVIAALRPVMPSTRR